MDADNSVIRQTNVPFCGAVEVPEEIPHKLGMHFVGWSEDIALSCVSESLVVEPLFEYDERSEVPYPESEEPYYPEPTTVVLTTTDDVDTIYYSVVEGRQTEFEYSDLMFRVYTSPFILAEDSTIVTYSSTANKADSFYGVFDYNFSDDNPPTYPDQPIPTYSLKWIVDEDTFAEQSLPEGAMIEEIDAPAKEGYAFMGWTPDIPDWMPAEDVEITALYSPKVFKVTFNAMGGVCDVETKNVRFDAGYGTLPTPQRDGCVFAGWSVGDSDAILTPQSIVSTASDHTLIANWKLLGDILNDNDINLKDIAILLRYLADGWDDVQVDLSVCDVNRDGTVDLRDVTVLRRFLAGGWGIQLI